MSEITRVYEFRIYNSAGAGVEYTFSDDDFLEGSPPRFGWGTPRPLDGKVENIPSVVRIVDTSEQITAILADAGGRTVLLGRIGEIRINESGGGLATVLKGRITGIFQAPLVSAFDFHISDDRWLEQAEVFDQGSTTQIMPPGLVSDWENIPATRKVRIEVTEVIDVDRLIFEFLDDPGLMGSRIVNWLDSDIQRQSPQKGNFLFTRLRASAGDREIITFGPAPNAGDTSAEDPLGYLRSVVEGGEPIAANVITVYWPGHGLVATNEIADTYVYAPNAPADEDVPIHVGGTAGQDPFDWIKDQYDTIGVRYETAAFTAWNAVTNVNGLISNPLIPVMFIRATKPEKLRTMVERICKTFGLVPFVNSSGEVAPRFVTMPHDVDPTTLTEVTAAIATIPHPTWGQQTMNMVTVCRPTYSQYRRIGKRESRENSNVPVDRVRHTIRKLADIDHDRLAENEAHVYDMDLTLVNTLQLAEYLSIQMSRELFDRYGDGAIEGQIEALSGASSIEPGDFIRLTVSSYPNMDTQARGGTRVVQVMGRETLITRTFSYLDAGPNSQPLTAPGVAIAQTAGDTHHSVTVTISGLTAGARYQLQLKIGSAEYVTVKEGSANEAVVITEMPSNTMISARARETKANTIRSEWSVPVNQATAALSAPTNALVSTAIFPLSRDGFLEFSGIAGNYASTPDHARLDIVGDIDLRARIAPDDWTPASNETVKAKWLGAGDERSYRLVLRTDGKLRLSWSTDGAAGTVVSVDSTVATGFTNGTIHWIRATLDVATGNVNFYTSDDGATWTQLGAADQGGAGATSINAGTALLEIGSRDGGTAALFAGKVYRAQVYDGIAGTLVFDADPQDLSTHTSTTTFTEKENSAVVTTFATFASDRAIGSWTNNETNYHLEVFLDGTQLAILEPETTTYLLENLTASTNYNSPGFAVRYVDLYGGASATDTDDFSTTAVDTTLIQPFSVAALVGGDKV